MIPGGEAPRSIGVIDGRIEAVESSSADLPAARVVEVDDDAVVLPGVVDTHVHVCEPGNTAWEGFERATKAAARGGITTLVDMPIDSIPPTVSASALERKRVSTIGKAYVDLAFWAGAIPGNLDEFASLRAAGVCGFKCFLSDTGDPDFPRVEISQLEQALQATRDLDVPLLVHAESAGVLEASPPAQGRRFTDYLASRPRDAENVAVSQVIDAARRTGGHAHVVHLSSADALAMMVAARREGIRVSTETCPHYLTFSAEEIADGATAFKCSPPIREASNREQLWQGLKQGTIDMIVSDHSPSTPAMKHLEDGDFGVAWGGISSLQLSLSAVWTQARQRGCTLSQVATWMAERPARIAGLSNKGKIASGFDADLCVFAPDESFVVDPARLEHRHPITPYAGRVLTGVVRQTFLRGEPVDLRQARGRLLERSRKAGKMEEVVA
jgi:allantoinase